MVKISLFARLDVSSSVSANSTGRMSRVEHPTESGGEKTKAGDKKYCCRVVIYVGNTGEKIKGCEFQVGAHPVEDFLERHGEIIGDDLPHLSDEALREIWSDGLKLPCIECLRLYGGNDGVKAGGLALLVTAELLRRNRVRDLGEQGLSPGRH